MSYSELLKEYNNLNNKDHQLEEVLYYLDNNQNSPEELNALKDMINHQKYMKDSDEWVSNSLLPSDDFVSDDFVSIDHQEMMGDMYTFEDENNTHELFANNPWESRSPRNQVTKKSETVFTVEITKSGDNYYTGISKYGKVYIPKSFECDDEKSIQVRARFQGFDGCRKTSLPWRAVNKL